MASYKNKNRTYALFTSLTGVATIGLGLLNNFWIYSICMVLLGLFISTRGAPSMSMLQLNISKKYMGRSMSILMVIATLFVQLGMVLWGPFSDIVEIEWLLLGSGTFILLMGFAIIFDKDLSKAGMVLTRVDDDTDTNNSD